MVYSHKLRELRDKRGISNHELAELSHVPESTVCRIMSGQTDNPSFSTICDIVTALGGDLNEITGMEAQHPAPAAVSTQAGDGLAERVAVLENKLTMMERAMFDKNKWLLRMFAYSCTLTALAIIIAWVEWGSV